LALGLQIYSRMSGQKKRLSWVALIAVIAASGCGKAVNSANQTQQDGVPVTGVGGFGTQCALTGSRGDPVPVALNSYSCTDDSHKLELAAPLLPVILQADCMKKQVLAYSVDGMRIENRWDALPDGRFYFTMYAGAASFAKGPRGQSGCQTPLALEVAGLMNCKDRDHAEVQLDATWRLNATPPGVTPHLTGPECAVPANCSFHAFADLHQCS